MGSNQSVYMGPLQQATTLSPAQVGWVNDGPCEVGLAAAETTGGSVGPDTCAGGLSANVQDSCA